MGSPTALLTSAPALLGAAALALVGCVSPPGEAPDAEASSQATGVVVVEGSSSAEGSRSQAVARFVRARSGAVDDDALRMVGASVDFPALGACEALSSLRSGVSSSTLALLDVGALTVSAGESAVPLQARQLPDVADLVSGVVYSARADELPARGPYMVKVDGSADLQVAPFVVSATSPGEPENLRIGGEDVSGAALALLLAEPVVLTWEPGAAEDVVYVDVTSGGAAPATRCLFADTGRGVIPAATFSGIEAGALAVHRLHRESFHARGVEPGEVRFDFARTVTFARR
jgi:hypothetical protein